MKIPKLVVPAVSALLLAAGSARAADWELWPDKTQMPPDDQTVGLPIVPTGENIVVTTETDSSWMFIDVHQTLEKDGQQYKAIQAFRDGEFEATVPVGKYLIGLIGTFYPPGTVDAMALAASWQLVSVELDGTTIAIDRSYLALRREFPFAGNDLAFYSVFPRFNTPGTHTYTQRFRPEAFFYVEYYDPVQGQVDPTPEFEGRRVLVPEQIGNPVDGEVVFKYTLTVVEESTAVPSSTWGQVKETQR
ncbi:MAG: hypothetical protein HUU43_06755 [Ignavibacteriaceae bacterium]|nr:hypothetical protein [Ignavibacteriaceae bacterium]